MIKFYLHIDDKELSQLVKLSIRKLVPKPLFSKEFDVNSEDLIVVSDKEKCLKDFPDTFKDNDTASLFLISDDVPPLSVSNVITFQRKNFSYDQFIQQLSVQLKKRVSEAEPAESVLSFFKEFTGGDEGFKNEMLFHFKNSFKEFVEDFQQQIKNKQFESAGKTAHKFKSSLRSIGADFFVSDVQKLEDLAVIHTDEKSALILFEEIQEKVKSLLKALNLK